MIAFTPAVQRTPGTPSGGTRRTGLQPDASSRRSHRLARLLTFGLVLAASEGWAPHPAEGSPIKHSHPLTETQHLDAQIGHSWAAYLMAGPSVWSKVIHPAVTPDLRASIWKALGSEDAASNPMVEFLMWKQSLDPTRFAKYHPHVAPILNRISTANLGTQTTAPPTSTSTPSGGTTPDTQPQTISPTVPEPGPWLLALGMSGWGLWWRRRPQAVVR
jgi:hypothetical protein